MTLQIEEFEDITKLLNELLDQEENTVENIENSVLKCLGLNYYKTESHVQKFNFNDGDLIKENENFDMDGQEII